MVGKEKLLNLCDTCEHRVNLVIETWDDSCGSYSYKRNGRCFDRESFCRITGKKLYSQTVVKCTHVSTVEKKKRTKK